MDLPPPDATRSPKPRRPRTRWGLLTCLLLVTLFVITIAKRNAIRARYWAYRLAAAESPQEQTHYLNCILAVRDEAEGAIRWLGRQDDPNARLLAVIILGTRAGGFETARLPRFLSDPDLTVRESAALALAFSRASFAADLLADKAESDNPDTAAAAVVGLARMDSPAVVTKLCEALSRHPAALVRAQAAEALAQRLEDDTGDPVAGDKPPADETCLPFLSLVRALDDDGRFAGRLALEREIAAAAAFARGRGLPIPDDSVREPRAVEDRTVGAIAARELSRLTGRAVRPAQGLSADAQESLADQCRRWYRSRRPPEPAQNRDSASAPDVSS